MPSMALGAERRDGGYYCTEKFSGGVSYNDMLGQWQGAVFEPSTNFVMKLSFRETIKALGVDLIRIMYTSPTKEPREQTTVSTIPSHLQSMKLELLAATRRMDYTYTNSILVIIASSEYTQPVILMAPTTN
jgi:hypothetical protein